MQKIFLLVIFIFTLWLTKIDSINYCSSGLCPNGKQHIACGNNGNFAASCPKNARMVSLKPFKRLILNIHNSRRNKIASGALKKYRPAKRMATMQWDNELASIAAYNVKRCRMEHDECRNTLKFSKSGQNLAMMTYSGPQKSKSNAALIRNRVNAWWNEYKDCNMKYIRRYPRSYSGPDIGHFTVFVAEKNIRVGCAAVRFTKGRTHYFIIACNYATTNIVGKPIYRAGKAASGCRRGRNPNFKSLCSTREWYAGLK